MKKRIIIIATLFLSIYCMGQTQNELSIYGGGGLSTLTYSVNGGESSMGTGMDFGIGYTFLFNEQWGINTGLGIATYNAESSVNGTTAVTPDLRDSENFLFDMHTTLSAYNETQQAMYLNIPVMIQFQTGAAHKFYALGGAKIGIPLKGSYQASDITLNNRGYYPEYDNWVSTQEFAGFGSFTNKSSDGKSDFGIAVLLSLESGMKWRLSEKLSLYTGAYLDYGLNNIVNDNNKGFLEYNTANPAEFKTNSVLSSSALADKVSLMAAGIKLRIAFGM